MFKVVRYCVQPYERHDGALMSGEPMQFREGADALRAAQVMGRRVAGAAVYVVTGWPVQDLWSSPRLIAKYGELPADVG